MSLTPEGGLPALLDFRHVTVARDGKPVLHNLSLRIDQGEHTALIGPNGSGKSTLIKTITRDLYPLQHPQGLTRLEILGRDRWNVYDLRGLLGIVSNDLLHLATREVSGHDAVLSGFFSSFEVWPEQHEVEPYMLERTAQILDLLEIGHLARRSVAHLSSGEAKRILIGRALVHDPKALLFDEPSNSLDFHAQKEFREIVRKIARSGITLLLVTHNLPDIIPEVERVVFLQQGRIFRDGSKADLLAPGPLTDLFGSPVELARKDGYFQIW